MKINFVLNRYVNFFLTKPPANMELVWLQMFVPVKSVGKALDVKYAYHYLDALMEVVSPKLSNAFVTMKPCGLDIIVINVRY